MDFSYVFTSKATKKTDLCICQKVKKKKKENLNSSSTGRENVIDLSNKLWIIDELLKGITDLSVIQCHSNGYYKPYTYLASSKRTWKKKAEKYIEQKIIKPKVQC